MKQQFLSCDWGTSSFRLRLIDAATLSVLGELFTADGIMKTYTAWKEQGLPEEKRVDFYRSILAEGINKISMQVNDPLNGLPVIISGMASANIGMLELPYKELPVFADGSNLYTKLIPADKNFDRNIWLVSGIRSINDVMRGEEVQLAGALSDEHEEQLFVFPGTHSKHVRVKNGQVEQFTTYMTGEFFELLSQKSILAGSVETEPAVTEQVRMDAFRKGVEEGIHSSLLHSSFTVRTNQLFGYLSKTENYYYLSGLLIASEMKELTGTPVPVTIVADALKQVYYTLAANRLGLHRLNYVNLDTALIKGHARMFALLLRN